MAGTSVERIPSPREAAGAKLISISTNFNVWREINAKELALAIQSLRSDNQRELARNEGKQVSFLAVELTGNPDLGSVKQVLLDLPKSNEVLSYGLEDPRWSSLRTLTDAGIMEQKVPDAQTWRGLADFQNDPVLFVLTNLGGKVLASIKGAKPVADLRRADSGESAPTT